MYKEYTIKRNSMTNQTLRMMQNRIRELIVMDRLMAISRELRLPGPAYGLDEGGYRKIPSCFARSADLVE